MILQNLQPTEYFKHFEAISQIPRGSGNEKAICDYLYDFATQHGLKAVRDDYHNVVIFKPATPGFEDKPPLILQGHTDMVCEKNEGTNHDFLRDPIKLKIEGDYVTADGTTLGADNGTAVAFCMAIITSPNMAHPPLEMVLTSDEEAGMSGAKNLDVSILSAKRMINLDTSDDDTIVTGSASGDTVLYILPAEWEQAGEFSLMYNVSVSGLVGGHSGQDITLGRGNSLKILGELLYQLENEFGTDIRIAKACGGMKINAIPREASATVAIKPSPENEAAFKKRMDYQIDRIKKEFTAADPGLTIEFKKAPTAEKVLTSKASQALSASLCIIHSGVKAMSAEIEGLPEISNNVSVLEITETEITIYSMTRAAKNGLAEQIQKTMQLQAREQGGEIKITQRSSAWAYDPASKLRKTAIEVYQKLHAEPPKTTAVHSGLECGILQNRIPGLDVISFGPNNHDLHTPDERLSISSTAKVWEFLLELLREV